MQGLRHVPASAQPRSRHRRQRLSSTTQPGVAKAPSETPPRDQLCPKTTHRRDPKNRGSPERSTPTQGVRHRPHDEAASTPDSQHHSKLAFNTTPHRPEPRRHPIHRLDRRCPTDDISGRRVCHATPTPPHRSRSGTSRSRGAPKCAPSSRWCGAPVGAQPVELCRIVRRSVTCRAEWRVRQSGSSAWC